MSAGKPRIAFWFRYGPAEHTELFHALPDIIAGLAERCEVHYYGLQSHRPVPRLIAERAVLHLLPIRVNRADHRDKFVKTALWLLLLPLIALHARLKRVRAVYIDETLPLTGGVALLLCTPRTAVTVTDFFLDIYGARFRPLRWVRPLVNRCDMAAWRRMPLIFTRARTTVAYLAARGVPAARVRPVYDPCDFRLYRPLDRLACRRRFGYGAGDLVLVHHGILHPNKGNDVILRALTGLRARLPAVRFLLVGDGPDRRRLEALATELGVNDIVRFTGWLPGPADVNEALNAGDIGLVMRLGGETDHFALTGTLIHNMACGLPILAARLDSVAEVVRDGENGYLFDPTDPADFAAKLERLAADAGLRERLGRAALERARELFDMRDVTRQTVNALLELVGSEAAPGAPDGHA